MTALCEAVMAARGCGCGELHARFSENPAPSDGVYIILDDIAQEFLRVEVRSRALVARKEIAKWVQRAAVEFYLGTRYRSVFHPYRPEKATIIKSYKTIRHQCPAIE